MRKAEIVGLTWDREDLKGGFIRLREVDTKTSERRSIPVGRELRDLPQSLPLAVDPRGNQVSIVFTRKGQPIKSICEIFSRVSRDAGLTDTTKMTGGDNCRDGAKALHIAMITMPGWRNR